MRDQSQTQGSEAELGKFKLLLLSVREVALSLAADEERMDKALKRVAHGIGVDLFD